ncbi:MAG: TatD family hydrolase [Verrucomicrobiales bacterium]|nr:TatD family hydrolase [Verrucomicrobiales bacterium]
MRLVDAHNHLHDERYEGRQDALVAACRKAGIARMVVNGSCEADWPAVAALAARYPDLVVPAFGLHPWYLRERTSDWQGCLRRYLDGCPGATVGEIGMDRWILECPPAARAAVSPELAVLQAPPLEEQGEVFAKQLAIAAEYEVTASVHCLQAWGALHDRLRAGPRPARGLLLHSYGGPVELVEPLARLGAYFSFPGYFLQTRKLRQREVFRHVPEARLLVETDAPDQRLPMTPPWRQDQLDETSESAAVGCEWSPPVEIPGPNGGCLNHPVNLGLVYCGLSVILRIPLERLAEVAERNFERLFGPTPNQPPR